MRDAPHLGDRATVDRNDTSDLSFGGLYRSAQPQERLRTADGIALVLTLVWLAATAGFFLVLGGEGSDFDPLRLIMVLLAIFLPVALIWFAAFAAKTSHAVRGEVERLNGVVDGLRQDYLAFQRSAVPASAPSDVSGKLDKIAEAQKKTEVALARFISIRPGADIQPPPAADAGPVESQATLELGAPTQAMGPPLGQEDFISALQFPADPDDKVGFRALRRALEDHRASQLVTAAQDVLTLLSQDGIYMDDLISERARPDLWRRFAKGERGPAIGSLGGIRDRASLTLTASRMRNDTIFRDACHHFLRLFDHILSEVEERMNDEQVVRMMDTRTARAFMLLGRVTNIFE